MPRSRGITIVELLVVIAIIAMLTSLLIPALGGLRHSARVTKDLAHVRALQQAHFARAVDHDGELVDVGLPHGGLIDETIAWVETLSDYYDHPLVLMSPLDTSLHWSPEKGGGVPLPGTDDRYRLTSYGRNNYLSRTYSPHAAVDPARVHDRLSRINSPSNTIDFLPMTGTGAFAGADHVHVENWWAGDFAPDLPPSVAASQVQTDQVNGTTADWSARANYGFLDGHARTFAFSNVYLNPDINRFDPEVSAMFGIRSSTAAASGGQ